jgi:flagellin FlaB
MVEPKLPRKSDADRGQVGIETLIIFIAMILVAAVAAGVLINTAGFLQNKASATSHESQKQVSNQVIVISGTGTVNNDSDNKPQKIDEISLTVMQSPGSDAIDLNASTVEIIGPNGEATLIHAKKTALGSLEKGEFNVSAEKDPDDSVPVLNEKEDRFVIAIPLASAGAGDLTGPQAALDTGEEMTIKIVTQSGSQYVYVATVPDTLASHDADEAVSL